MLDVCSSGDIAALRRLFIKHGIQPGSKPTYGRTKHMEKNISPVESTVVSDPGMPSTMELLGRAVATKQLAVVKFILQTYSSFSHNYHMRSILSDACERPPVQIVPILHVLLDNGADVDDGWPRHGALYSAIHYKRPLEIIRKIVSKGANINSGNLIQAIQHDRLDVTKWLFSSGKDDPDVDVQLCVEKAKESGDEEIIAIAQAWA
ncbi:hypothetical protein OIDMADRAFT_57703 [Oidiodendron maius Zn]|uniref:Ankyrin repeat protein n=1 Tax=Oidiodendron maius (strain Zn) TaxID=913774 RepID=A0A0C3H3E7_OIDMZ|nr:hypothetical protein OIDMADRAFT_57703 [Oidiodendron maius Zn]